jgi:hypothetical protein
MSAIVVCDKGTFTSNADGNWTNAIVNTEVVLVICNEDNTEQRSDIAF